MCLAKNSVTTSWSSFSALQSLMISFSGSFHWSDSFSGAETPFWRIAVRFCVVLFEVVSCDKHGSNKFMVLEAGLE